MTLLRFRPIEQWPGPFTEWRTCPFSATYSSTKTLLLRELEALGVDEAVVQLAVRERDIRNDGMLRADVRTQHPGVILSFDHDEYGPLSYPCDAFAGGYKWANGKSREIEGWHANLRAIALGLEALRKVERYGIANRGQQYTGWKQIGSGIPMLGRQRMGREEAARLLCEATMETIGEDWRDVLSGRTPYRSLYAEAAKLHHPDVGGDPDLFRKLTEARDVLAAAS